MGPDSAESDLSLDASRTGATPIAPALFIETRLRCNGMLTCDVLVAGFDDTPDAMLEYPRHEVGAATISWLEARGIEFGATVPSKKTSAKKEAPHRGAPPCRVQ